MSKEDKINKSRTKRGSPKRDSRQSDEREILLDISAAMARVRDRDELFRFIADRVQPVFGFNQYFNIAVFDADQAALRMFFTLATDAELTKSEIPIFLKSFPVEGVFQTLVETDEIVILDESWKQSPKTAAIDRAVMQIWTDLHFKDGLHVALRSFGKLVGTFHVHFFEPQNFTDNKLRLFKAISEQIAVAVSNILANEEIIKREREKSILLSISEAIATIRDKDELWRVMMNKVQPLLGFKASVSTVYSADYSYYRYLLYSGVLTENSEREIKEHFDVDLPIAGTSDEWVLRQGDFCALSIEEKERIAGKNSLAIKILKSAGINYNIYIKLKSAGKTIGVQHFHFENRNTVTEKFVALAKSITDLIAAAVANILANEEILEREREKTLLLSLSEDMATIRDREDLWCVMMEKLRPLVGFDDAVVICFAPGGKSSKTLLTISDESRRQQPWYQYIKDNWIPTTAPLAYIYGLGTAYWTTAEILDKWKDFAGCLFMQSEGLHHTYQILLKHGGADLGIVLFHFKEKDSIVESKFALYKSIADQVAVAVANILANEEILEREQEKALLLSLSEDMATIRDRNDLWRVMMEKVSLLLPSEESPQVFVLNPDGKTLRTLLINPSQELQETPEYQQNIALNIPFKNTPFEDGLNAVAPQIFTFDYFRQKYPDYWGTKIWERGGIKEMLAMQLRYGKRILGNFNILTRRENAFSANHISLFKSTADQVAVAVANILANEEIAELAEERRERAEELERTNLALQRSALELSSLENIELFVHGVLVEIIKETNAKDAAVFQVTDDGAHLQMTHYAEGSRRIDIEGDAQFAMWREPKEPLNSVQAQKLMNGEVVWVDFDEQPLAGDWEESFPFHKMMGHRTVACLPLAVGGENVGFVGICFADLVKPTEAKIQLCQTLTQHAALALHFTRLSDEAQQVAVTREQEKAAIERAAELVKTNEALKEANLEIERQFEEIKKLKGKVEAENVYLIEELKANQNFAEIVGASPEIYAVFDAIEQVAPTDATILILGETGTGKELIARAIHERSPRAKRPLIKVNCAALPRELVESELFGHERGSFTGAHERRIGKFELANGSTIFLDEIGELSLDLQIKLLHVLQEREIERLGGKGMINLDLRVVAATNRNLKEEVERGTFRRDLYYRLNTIELTLPPLKNRREDIVPLTMHFAKKYAAKFSRKIESVSNEMLEEFYRYDFPGNVRELEHLIEQAVIFSRGDILRLPRSLTTNSETNMEKSSGNESFRIKTMDEMERDYLLRVLQETGGRIKGEAGAADLLDLPASTLHSKLKKLGIERKHIASRVENKN